MLIALTVLGAGVLGVAAPTSAAPAGIGAALEGTAAAPANDPKVDAAPIRSTDPQLSVPVRDLAVSAPTVADPGAAPARVNPLAALPDQGVGGTASRGMPPLDPLLSPGRAKLTVQTPPARLVFDGVGNPEGCGTCAPPDTTGDVGPNHYIQMVNSTKVAIYSKSGVLLKPAFNLSTLFKDGDCSKFDRGDPQVLYDPIAGRWLLSQFTPRGSNQLCFAISQTADPLGSYHLYSFTTPDFPDYFKVGVWPTGYYVSANEGSYTAYALDRTKMLAGLPATAVRVAGETNLLMPADVDGSAAPANSGGLFYTFKSKDFAAHNVTFDQLQVFRLTPDFTTPANTTFSTIAAIPIAPFKYTVCGFFVMECIPQKDTNITVDPVSEWPMQRFAYRKLAGRETLVGNFTVGGGTAAPGAAIRWFELSNSGSGWTLRQEGTQDLGDGLNRFMGSIAMDADGNIALGYSASGASAYPSIRYATRAATDPLGTMQAERVMRAGTGSQTGTERWGDYSAMSVDPSTDRSFWYTNEYYSPTADRNWRTAIGTFGFASQTITFSQPANTVLTAGPVRMAATGGGSGNPVVFTSATPGSCTTGGPNGATVTLRAIGTCVINANQAGNGSYNPAPQVRRSFRVTATPQLAQLPLAGCVTPPGAIPLAGLRQLMRPACVTNAGQPVRVQVSGFRRGEIRYWTVIRNRNGSVFLRTFGYPLQLWITWSAPAIGNYRAYQLVRSYRS
ncbi:MAG: LysM peptidoglycan-binding protein [Actinomycetota bacterium]|nr:LysM peptidoglycan-binding protein [Actinomycetota bacterium]